MLGLLFVFVRFGDHDYVCNMGPKELVRCQIVVEKN